MESTAHAPGRGEPFDHAALFYRDARAYLAATVPFLRRGLAAGEPVAAVLPAPRLKLLTEALGADAARVRLLDMREVGRNPGRIIPGVLRAFADAHPGAPWVRIIGEPVWAGRTDTEYPACAAHEALINKAFAGRNVSILCPYDASALDPEALADAAATHPVVWERGTRRTSADYAPERVVDACNRPLPEPAAPVATARFAAEHLELVRHFTTTHARRAGVQEERLPEIEMIVGELSANSVRHGGGSGTVRVWHEEGHFVCEVSDAGQITDPLAGRLPAPLTRPGGHGLLVVHHLSDLVRVHTGPGSTTTRAYIRLPWPSSPSKPA
ncbi:sensor histidine kinase [Streptomyces sp. ODS28]|uniref:sensor histidine kinase n=1 Tax=Streptomyces sp. ODS28 TaxID=3136688 RepID=UPI0031F064DD